jgi:hypothetical protein
VGQPAPRAPRGRALRADWLWTTRPGAEHDLCEELEIAGVRARQVGPALVRSDAAPTLPSGLLDLTFARHGFRVLGEARGDVVEESAALLAPAVHGARAWALDAWVPDSDATNPHAELALSTRSWRCRRRSGRRRRRAVCSRSSASSSPGVRSPVSCPRPKR